MGLFLRRLLLSIILVTLSLVLTQAFLLPYLMERFSNNTFLTTYLPIWLPRCAALYGFYLAFLKPHPHHHGHDDKQSN